LRGGLAEACPTSLVGELDEMTGHRVLRLHDHSASLTHVAREAHSFCDHEFVGV